MTTELRELRTLRADFPWLQQTTDDGRPLVYLDSTATTQKPVQVLDAMDDYYRHHNANVHRSAFRIADRATKMYEAARAKVAAFINAADPAEVVLTRGATTSLNFVASGWARPRLRPGDRVVVTSMEHHANWVPWQMLERDLGIELGYVPLTADYRIDTSKLDELIDDRVKIVSFSGMSNVVGTIAPISELAAAARAVGALVVVDGAQLVPHVPIDVQALDIDFLAFSGHKMLGPTGIGVLWGRRERLEELSPPEGGGEMIDQVHLDHFTMNTLPHRLEAGTPPIAEAIGLGAAVDYLSDVGMDAVRAHEVDLTGYALRVLAEVPRLTIYGPTDPQVRGGAISFTIDGMRLDDIESALDAEGICIRGGHHCAQPLMRAHDLPQTARASLYLYNTREEVDRLGRVLEKVVAYGI